MNSREQTLSLILIATVVLFVAGAGGYFFVWQPIQKQRAAAQTLRDDIGKLEKEVAEQRATKAKVEFYRARSLPADKTIAEREYFLTLQRLVETAGVPAGFSIVPKQVDNSARVVPQISKDKPVYTLVAYELVLKKVDMWMIKDFLEQYYRLGATHQIKSLVIKKDDESNAKKASVRNDLTVTLTTEAIIVEGAQDRRTLLPVPTAFAAVGGGPLHAAMLLTPEATRSVRSTVTTQILATPARDYSVIVRKDPFSGPLQDPPKYAFKMEKIADTKVKTDEKSDPVKVKLSGEGSVGATVTALAEGTLFAPGALKVDPKTHAIELPKTSAYEGTATISVIATPSDGSKPEKTSFKVSLAEPEIPSPPLPGEDLSGAILLIGIARSDTGVWVRVIDQASRYRYLIDATPKGVTVVKEETLPGRPWKPDSSHKLPPGYIQLNSHAKATRTFKIVAVNSDSLVLTEQLPVKADPSKTRPGKQGPGSPLAAVAGNLAVVLNPPKYYRWPVGQPLSKIESLLPSQIKALQQAAETNGPVLDVAAK